MIVLENTQGYDASSGRNDVVFLVMFIMLVAVRMPMVMGRGLTRAARIEPRTPAGEVYVTTGFAALLRLEPDSGVTSEYVGHLTTAKNFETTPMYLLRRKGPANRP